MATIKNSAAKVFLAPATAMLLAGGVLAAGSPVVLPVAAAQGAQGAEDPALKQTVTDKEEHIPAGTAHVFDRGHADLGMRLDGGKLDVQLRDDAEEKPVWRVLDDVVFDVSDKAKQQLPADGGYEFTGAQPGQEVWVLPQTEVQGVPWLGWNTQSPALIAQANRGVTMEYLGHQGPGQMSMFLQAGGFEKPQELWNSAQPTPQDLWVDLNTHTHANWVFTEPGVHRVAMGVRVKMKDGSEKTTTKVLTFAVGVDPAEAQNSGWEGELPKAGAASSGDANAANANNSNSNNGADGNSNNASDEDSSEKSSSALPWILVGVGVVVVAVLVLGFLSLRKGAKERKRIEDELWGQLK
ncbi:choice-of-anchor M domain-containing protein [Corynebacterium sp. 22_2729]